MPITELYCPQCCKPQAVRQGGKRYSCTLCGNALELPKDEQPVVLKAVKTATPPRKKPTKKRVQTAVQEHQAALEVVAGLIAGEAKQPFMLRNGWRSQEVLAAIEIMQTIPEGEHDEINWFLDRPGVSPRDGLPMLRNLRSMKANQRKRLYALRRSEDPREQSLALTIAAQKVPKPDHQSVLARHFARALEALRRRYHQEWVANFQNEPWSPGLQEIEARFHAIKARWREIGKQVEAQHKQRIATHEQGLNEA